MYNSMDYDEAIKSIYTLSKDDRRVLIDNYAKEMLRKDTELAYNILSNPEYKFGEVNNTCPKFKWNTSKLKKSSIIENIVKLYNDLQFDEGASYIYYKDTTTPMIDTPIEVIKFLKALILGHMSVNQDFSVAVAKYTRTALDLLRDGLVYPIEPVADSDLENILFEELNCFYKEILDSNNIKYSEVLKEKKKKTSKKKTSSTNKIEKVEGEVVGVFSSNLNKMFSYAVDDIID